jgi:hypothetical protein
VAQLGPGPEVPLTAIHHAYLDAFDHVLLGETLAERLRGRRVMDGCLPYVLAQSRKEELLDKRARRGGRNRGPQHNSPLEHLMQDLAEDE